MRGRNRNKGPNPLTRSYESNGPDVKIRGTAQHIAEKYSQLARDAQASGDPVAAENYLQHAEHYYRIIATAQEQYREQFGGFQRPYDDDGDDDGSFPYPGDRPASGEDMDPGIQPQPFEMRAEGGDRPERPRFDRQDRGQDRGQDRAQDRGERFDRGPRPERNEQRFDRPGGDRPDRQDRRERFRDRNRPDFQNRQDFQRPDSFQRPDPQRLDNGRGDGPREDRQEFQGQDAPRQQEFPRPPREEQPRFERRERRRDEDAPVNGSLPAFLTTPVRVPIAAEDSSAEPEASPAEGAPEGEGSEPNGRYPRARRRRRRPFEAGEGAPEPSADFAPEGAETPPAE
jgi:hypothetical protein